MADRGERMVDRDNPPDEEALSLWLGDECSRYWTHIVSFIKDNYPGVFVPEWLFGGKKHGWSLRYKKSKSFCTLIPERGRCMIQIVFGAQEREKAEAILPELSARVREAYQVATTYHDGKWLFLEIDGADTLSDVEHLLMIKRRPATKPT